MRWGDGFGRLLITTSASLMLAGCLTVPPVAERRAVGRALEGRIGSQGIRDVAERPASEPERARDRAPDRARAGAQEPADRDRDRSDIWERVREGLVLPDAARSGQAVAGRWPDLHQAFIDQIVERATPYLHHIVEEVERRDMPTDVALLPIVESAYRAEARSPGHAAGIWQMIPSTGRRLGLEQNAWYDGRRDVLASTDAALDYLEALHERFGGDWLNAFAAYNCGEGLVERAIAQNRRAGRRTDFWSLRLPAETRGFVPKLIAVSRIVANPARHKVNLPRIPDQPYLTEVEVGRQIRLAEAAALAGMSVEELKRLNPGFIRSVTAPSGPHRLAVPVDKAALFTRRLAAGRSSPPEGPPSARGRQGPRARKDGRQAERIARALPAGTGTAHRVRAGETLGEIAHAYRIPLATLREANGLGSSSAIRSGQELHIPAGGAVEGAASMAKKAHVVHHRIRPGDSLPRIARRYRVSVNQLRRWNRPAVYRSLKPGSVLLVYRSV